MHRTGTSAVSGALAACGFYPGQDLLPADPGYNDKGFFESRPVVEIHDKFFASFSTDWRYCYQLPEGCFESEAAELAMAEIRSVLASDFQTRQPWCIKDPRASVLFPLWRKVLDEQAIDYRVLLVQRQPAAVANSLLRRNEMPSNQGLLLWLYHSLCAEKYSRSCTRTVINYEVLLENPAAELKNALSRIGLKDVVCPDDIGIEKSLSHSAETPQVPEFVSKAYELLVRDPLPTEELDQVGASVGPLLKLVPDVRALEQAAHKRFEDLTLANEHADNLTQVVEDLRDQLSRSIHTIESQRTELDQERSLRLSEVAQLSDELLAAESELEKVSHAYESIRSSVFWRVNRPARFLVEQLRRLRFTRTRRALHYIALKPEQDVQLNKGWYASVGQAPQMLLVTDQDRLPAGRVELSFDLETRDCEFSAPKLIVNHGFEEHHLELELPQMLMGRNTLKLHLPTHINCLRFDPMEGEGDFNIRDFTIRELI